MRFALPSRMGVLVALALAGCQSGGQSDLVTRELRMQEDQIYAMEDYLSQYQQLLCEVRAENADLRRQIADLQDCDTLPAPAKTEESSKVRERSRVKGPSFRTPERAPVKNDEQVNPPDTEIIVPDVPPLEKTSFEDWSVDRGRELRQAQSSGRPGSLQEVQGRQIIVRGQSPDSQSASKNAPARFVQIRGEVVVNESGGGPRLAVDVDALSAEFEPTRAVGAVSLMLLEPKSGGAPISLARWDYSAADAQALLNKSSQPGTMQFHLELPADTPIDRPTEFWVRLMPEGGGKVLGHVRMDLSRPTRFESKKDGEMVRDGWANGQADVDGAIVKAVHQDVVPALDLRGDEGWSVARPDRPGQLGVGGESNAQWRAASGPLPDIVASVKPAVQQAEFVESAKPPQAAPAPVDPPAAATTVRAVPVWTPERGGKAADAAKTASDEPRAAARLARPAWSPVR